MVENIKNIHQFTVIFIDLIDYPAWYPYLTRRMAERPANLWFFVRALFGR